MKVFISCLLYVMSSVTVFAQATNRMTSVEDVKIVLAQCSGRFMFTAGLIRAGVITYPGDMARQNQAASSKLALDMLDVANRLPGVNARAEAERFFELLKSSHNHRMKNHRDKESVKEAMDEAFGAHDRCIAYMGNPTVQKLLRGY